jgi:hypothetical protein
MTEESGFDFQEEYEIFLISITYELALGSTQPPIQWVLGTAEVLHRPLTSI